jgi:hypothetical protein
MAFFSIDSAYVSSLAQGRPGAGGGMRGGC